MAQRMGQGQLIQKPRRLTLNLDQFVRVGHLQVFPPCFFPLHLPEQHSLSKEHGSPL